MRLNLAHSDDVGMMWVGDRREQAQSMTPPWPLKVCDLCIPVTASEMENAECMSGDEDEEADSDLSTVGAVEEW